MTATQMTANAAQAMFDSFGSALRDALAANVAAAIGEDVGTGDRTGLLVPAERHARARVIVREAAVLCGTPWFDACMRAVDPALRVTWLQHEGDRMAPDSGVCEIEGPARALLTAERPSLNFLQLLSGVATATSRYAEAIAGTRGPACLTRARRCRACAWHRNTLFVSAVARTSGWRCTTASSSRKTISPRPAA